MSPQVLPVPLHPEGEPSTTALAAQAVLDPPVPVDTVGRRFHVEWDPDAPVTPLGQLVFFAQFLAAGGRSMPIGSADARSAMPVPTHPRLPTCWALGLLAT